MTPKRPTKKRLSDERLIAAVEIERA